MKIRDLSEKGVLFVAQIRGKGGCFLTLEHEYVPFLGPRGGAGPRRALVELNTENDSFQVLPMFE